MHTNEKARWCNLQQDTSMSLHTRWEGHGVDGHYQNGMSTQKPLLSKTTIQDCTNILGLHRQTQMTAAMFIDVGETAESPLQKVTGDNRGATFTTSPLGLAVKWTIRGMESKPLIGQELVI